MIELSPDFWHGIELFNQQEFFECHEVLEEVWNHQTEPEKTLTQGIIQIAVAHYHALRDNYVGAEKLLTRGLARVEKSLGLDVLLDVKSLWVDANNSLLAVQTRRHPSGFDIRRK